MKKPLKKYLCSTGCLASFIFFFGWGNAAAKDLSWGKIPDTSQRFKPLANFNNEAVLDRETGLVWDKCPTNDYLNANNKKATWRNAMLTCMNRKVGGRMGFRLPTVAELTSLGDEGSTPFLPNQAPFCTEVSGFFWTSTEDPDFPSAAMMVNADSSFFNLPTVDKDDLVHIWCVRGDSGD